MKFLHLSLILAFSGMATHSATAATDGFYTPQRVSAEILLKVPGNAAQSTPLQLEKLSGDHYDYALRSASPCCWVF